MHHMVHYVKIWHHTQNKKCEFSRYAIIETDRQVDTDTLIVILCTPTGDKVNLIYLQYDDQVLWSSNNIFQLNAVTGSNADVFSFSS